VSTLVSSAPTTALAVLITTHASARSHHHSRQCTLSSSPLTPVHAFVYWGFGFLVDPSSTSHSIAALWLPQCAIAVAAPVRHRWDLGCTGPHVDHN
jgi:hypothetical protein